MIRFVPKETIKRAGDIVRNDQTRRFVKSRT